LRGLEAAPALLATLLRGLVAVSALLTGLLLALLTALLIACHAPLSVRVQE
jgi:hypothetical protein